VTFATPSQMSTALGSMDRGRIERLDLTVHIPIADVDRDGLPDDWETVYCGCVTCCDPEADVDGAGLAMWEEYHAGTDPNDPQSAFRFIRYDVHLAGGFQVEWSSMAGRAYVLERSAALANDWVVVRSDVAATPPQNLYHDTTATGAGPYFYRLRLSP